MVQHGLGHLLNPVDLESEDRKWTATVWLDMVRRARGLPTQHLTFVACDTTQEKLGGGKTAMVFSEHGDDSGSLSLVEYRDGLDLRHMRTLQTIGAGE